MKIGFVGLGNMGYHMVNNLLKNGFEVFTYDVSEEAVARTVEIGACGCANLKELAEHVHIVQVMVFDDAQVRNVIFGRDGLAENLSEGSIISVSSTISPAQTKKNAEDLKKFGIEYADCPVSGGKDGAINGELIIMAACTDAVYERMKPAYLAMARHATHHVSTIIGNGQVMKSINQVMIATGMAIAAEAVTYAVKSGLQPEDIYEVIGKCTGCSDVFRDKLPLIMKRDFAVRGQVDIYIKDLSIALDIGKNVKSPMFISALIKQIYSWASSCGYGDLDLGGLICAYEDCAKVKVVSKE